MKWILAFLLAASVALAHSVVILCSVETTIEIDDDAGTTNESNWVVLFFNKMGSRYQSAESLPVNYSATDLSNAVSIGAANIARAHQVPDYTPQRVMLP